jgi:hypothetical protein
LRVSLLGIIYGQGLRYSRQCSAALQGGIRLPQTRMQG